ncbi:50S ribosomal protein L1, chloroplastic [Apostasia shenzhenica]|uniref:Large ribosomal subunit protein uL1c n=1 Tax=Apostasia shenzhenica TaxID=1088818 RepID=A0A2I0B9K5_9ASPA|nr:50S ribosomal protein L1, chloroplastic [Apostasia shenzhenica]
MAHLEILFHHARRRRLWPLFVLHSHQSLSFVSSGLWFLRPFSSVPIKPVAYPPKPKDPNEGGEEKPSPPSETTHSRVPRRERADVSAPEGGAASADAGQREWTRRDVRFVKDIPKITPVSYPARVAPLPEDRVAPEAVEEERGREGDDQLRREGKRIQSDARVRSYFALEQQEFVPFPTLIKVEKQLAKVPMDLGEAIREVKANAKSKFVETVEAHVNLGVDPRRGDQMVRGATTLPHGTGKIVRIAVFAEGAAAEEARAAGADIVGGDELIEEIKAGGGKINFDKCIATPVFMPRLSKVARILGPRGLMPNPKLGSVTSDVSSAVKEAKCGRIDFKIDKTAIVHVGLGKVNFSEQSLRENIGAFVNALLLAKPVGLKKTSKYAGYVKNFTLSSTMGPGFPVSIQSLSTAADHYNKLHGK